MARRQCTNGISLAALRMPILPSQIDPSGLHLASLVGSASTSVMNSDLNAASQAVRYFPAFPGYSESSLLLRISALNRRPRQAIFGVEKSWISSPSKRDTSSRAGVDSSIIRGGFRWCIALRDKGRRGGTLPGDRAACTGRDSGVDGDVRGGLPHLEAVLQGERRDRLERRLALVKASCGLGRKDDAERTSSLSDAYVAGRTADANPSRVWALMLYRACLSADPRKATIRSPKLPSATD